MSLPRKRTWTRPEISLPLNEILPQINPAMIARRQSQKHVLVPEDIHGPFGKDLAGVSLRWPILAPPSRSRRRKRPCRPRAK